MTQPIESFEDFRAKELELTHPTLEQVVGFVNWRSLKIQFDRDSQIGRERE